MHLEKRDLYRFPWSMNDNPIGWVEVTDLCNLRCEGCYRQTLTRHKPLEEVREEIRFLKRWRNPDNISIAGGEPLIHPQIVEIVADIAENGLKPIILSNAHALTPQLLRELKRAGLAGFTLHIDSHQARPGWEGVDEAGHNALRQHYAEMIAAERGLCLVFNATVFPATCHEVPAVVRWGQAHPDTVHGLVFITFRTATTESSVALDAASQQVDLGELSYARERYDERFVTGPEVCDMIQQACPAFQPSGYLGGTIRHDAFKWLAGGIIATRDAVHGAVGPRTMELAQSAHHLLKGTYLAYLSQARLGALPAALALVLLSPWDASLRRAARHWLGGVLRQPGRLFRPLYIQSIGIIQAPDLLPDGRADMCDSCPDMTYYDGKLVNSCRMDEYRLFGGLLSVVSRGTPSAAPHAEQGEAGAG